ncbi:MAG: hypothetical protein LUE13_08765 [Akkermansiaceae bacterium]|nr:hypothetical protein [Akkermansiaceae bacterium]
MNFVRVQQFPDHFDTETFRHFMGHCSTVIYQKEIKGGTGAKIEYSANGKETNRFAPIKYSPFLKEGGIKVQIYAC